MVLRCSVTAYCAQTLRTSNSLCHTHSSVTELDAFNGCSVTELLYQKCIKTFPVILLASFNERHGSMIVLLYRWWLGSPVVRAFDLQLDGCKFNSRLWHCRVTTLGKLFTPTCLCRSQWFSDGMIDCGVTGRGQLCLSRQPLRCTALGMGCAPFLPCLGRLSLLPCVGR